MSTPTTSLACPLCGPFRGFPLATPEAVEDHLANVHGEGFRAEGGEDLAAFLLDRLHGCPELPDAPEGRCQDECGHVGRRVWIAARQVCRPCGRKRLTAREAA
jgi:hypothetical protein